MPASTFLFYCTFLPTLSELNDAVVLSFDNKTFLRAYGTNVQDMPEHFIHSGNFFAAILKKTRTANKGESSGIAGTFNECKNKRHHDA